MAYKRPIETMKAKLLLLFSVLLVVSCANKSKEIEGKNALTKELLQGKWYTTILEANGHVIHTKEYPEALSSFVFKDDKVKLFQLGNHSENGGVFKVSNDTIYFNDLINNITVMTIKIDRISEKNLDVTIIGQDVKMKMERMEEN